MLGSIVQVVITCHPLMCHLFRSMTWELSPEQAQGKIQARNGFTQLEHKSTELTGNTRAG